MDEKEKTEGLLRKMKNIESKNEQQLEVIKDQGRKQLNAIERQNKN